jgi:hypothetical protein
MCVCGLDTDNYNLWRPEGRRPIHIYMYIFFRGKNRSVYYYSRHPHVVRGAEDKIRHPWVHAQKHTYEKCANPALSRVLPGRALYSPIFSHFLILNKNSLSLSLSLS